PPPRRLHGPNPSELVPAPSELVAVSGVFRRLLQRVRSWRVQEVPKQTKTRHRSPMILRTLARLVTCLALLAASGAWAGWVFLHTAGDPSRSRQIARAVLADPSARHERAGGGDPALGGAARRPLARAPARTPRAGLR